MCGGDTMCVCMCVHVPFWQQDKGPDHTGRDSTTRRHFLVFES